MYFIPVIVANHYEDTWVAYTSYTVAGLVGAARIYHDAHFTSDVVAGALIGTLVGKSVVGHNQSLRSGKAAILPEIAPDFIGVRITGNF